MTQIELEMDKFGRVLIPKKVRQALNITPGSKIRGEIEDGKLHLESAQAGYTIVREKDGWPVIHFHDSAPWPEDYDPVKEARDERTAQLLSGWDK